MKNIFKKSERANRHHKNIKVNSRRIKRQARKMDMLDLMTTREAIMNGEYSDEKKAWMLKVVENRINYVAEKELIKNMKGSIKDAKKTIKKDKKEFKRLVSKKAFA